MITIPKVRNYHKQYTSPKFKNAVVFIITYDENPTDLEHDIEEYLRNKHFKDDSSAWKEIEIDADTMRETHISINAEQRDSTIYYVIRKKLKGSPTEIIGENCFDISELD